MPTFNDPEVDQSAPRLADLIRSGCQGPINIDRARGVLLGLAVGNLLGLSVEGASATQIRRFYPDGISEIDPQERERLMDDDLAQAVELAESLAHDPDLLTDFAERLVRWRNENGRGIGIMTSTVIDYLEAELGVPWSAKAYWQDNGSPETQPNGALMRCAPVAVRYALDPEALIAQTTATCAVTHFAPGAQWSCIVVNAAIAILLRGGAPSLEDLATAAASDGAPPDLVTWILAIPDDIGRRIEEEPMIGHTYLAMQAALWCLNADTDLESALVRIVSAGGDTDTNAAVAGAVLGARYGASAIPDRWLACIPHINRIEKAVTDLLTQNR